jgi:ribonuclease-3
MDNPKGDLIEFCRNAKLRPPKFETRGTGPEHDPLFITDVLIDGEVKATGQGRSKRDSERIAAQLTLELLTEQLGVEPVKPARRGRKAAQPAPAEQPKRSEPTSWPLYAELLSRAVDVANSRVDPLRRGPDSIDMVRRLALDLYKGLLEELGPQPAALDS